MRHTRPAAVSIALVMAISTLLTVSTTHAGAEAIVVTTTEDELNADGDCSLREAVVAANTNASVDACPAGEGHDEIVVGAGTYTLSIAGADEDDAATGDLDLLEAVNIMVPARTAAPTIDGGALDRVFDVGEDARTVGFWGPMTIRNGNAGIENGGALRFQDNCSGSGPTNNLITSVVIEDSRAASGGGAWIGNCRRLEVSIVSMVRNQATHGGGALTLHGTASAIVQKSTLSGNTAGEAGGAIYGDLASEPLSVVYATLADNTAARGSAIAFDPGAEAPAASAWGTLNTTVIANNFGPACDVPSLSGHASISDDVGCSVSLHADNVGLEPLSTVSGFPVHQLQLGSAARDVDTVWPCPGEWVYDQVGTERPLDGDGDGIALCDAGAIEAAAVPVTGPTPTPAPLPDTAVPASGIGILHVALAAVAVIGVVGGWRLGWRRAPRR